MKNRKKKKKGSILTVIAVILVLAGRIFGVSDFVSDFSAQTIEISETVAEGEMKVVFLDVGQGDCTIVQAGGHNMVIDTGNNNKGDEVVSALEENGIEKLDYLILTHPDADHIGGGDNVLEALEVEKVIMPEVEKDTITYEEVVNDIEKYKVSLIRPEVGNTYSLGDAKFTILCPDKMEIAGENANEASIGIKLVHGDNSFVLCGDAEKISEQRMVEQFGESLECDVLKCGHHGSSTATTDEFLEATDPVYAVISCGRDNSYGHPHAEVIAKLEDDDIQIYRTDKMGTITAVSDGNNIRFH